jgi:hypothetical protein
MSGRDRSRSGAAGPSVPPDKVVAAYGREVTRLRRRGIAQAAFVIAFYPVTFGLAHLDRGLADRVGALIFMAWVALVAFILVMNRRQQPRVEAGRRAAAALNLEGQRMWADEWNALGIGPAPASPRECLEKLAPVDESDVTNNLRALLHLGQGETDEVRAILAAWQPGDPLAAARKELIEIRLRLEAGQDPAFERAEELVAAIPAGEDRRVGEATLAIVRARAALAAGSPDWWRAFPAPPGPGGRPRSGPITGLLARRRRRRP